MAATKSSSLVRCCVQDTNCLGWSLGPRQPLGKVVVDAGDAKVGFALEGVAQIAYAVSALFQKLD